MEFAKGFAVWDLAPGHYILHSAGGTAIDLDGQVVALDHGLNSLVEINAAMSTRRRFIAAGTSALAEAIRRTLV